MFRPLVVVFGIERHFPPRVALHLHRRVPRFGTCCLGRILRPRADHAPCPAPSLSQICCASFAGLHGTEVTEHLMEQCEPASACPRARHM